MRKNLDKEVIRDFEVAKKLGLMKDEFYMVIEYLGRYPTFCELCIYSGMWSEHTSYKNSLYWLRGLYRKGRYVLKSAGEENAGIIDFGGGLALVFKIESHNHPSAVEPYQGAATGVGGIMRDIFTVGAKPIASANSLRFGDINDKRVLYLYENVVRGIGDYGNCLGVPTVAGEVFFDDSYTENPLVNAMVVGIGKKKKLVYATAGKVGNVVAILGAKTGRDGIGGAIFASRDIDKEQKDEDRGAIQVGDPFTEKLLLEAVMEIVEAELVDGMQDMGAVGLSCATSEMSEKAGTGMEIVLDKVNLREKDIYGYEIMLSESQERMLLSLPQKNIEKVSKIAKKYELDFVIIGKVIKERKLKVWYHNELIADIPVSTLVAGKGAPVYVRKYRKPSVINIAMEKEIYVKEPKDYNEEILNLLKSPNISSKHYVYTQYDYQVGTNTVVGPGNNAAIMRVRGTKKGIAISTDCNPRFVYMEPINGGMYAVFEGVRNIAIMGAYPVGITDCLNFGNPYDEEVFYYFVKSIEGINLACKILNIPITGGNVSFYNQSKKGAILPTPTIGVVGIFDDVKKHITAGFKEENSYIILIGKEQPLLGGSEFLYQKTGEFVAKFPKVLPNMEVRILKLMLALVGEGIALSSIDVSLGGIGIALSKMVLLGNVGAFVDFSDVKEPLHYYLFSEPPGVVILEIKRDDFSRFLYFAKKFVVPFKIIGKTVPKRYLYINKIVSLSYEDMEEKYKKSFLPF